MRAKILVPALALTVALSGCTTNPYTGESQTSKGAWGALAGGGRRLRLRIWGGWAGLHAAAFERSHRLGTAMLS